MDKTGTLTEGNFRVTKVLSFESGLNETDILAMMGGLEQNSNHPLAAGILREAHDQNIKLSGADDVKNVPGVGLEGTLGGKKLSIVSASYLDRNNLAR